MDREKLIFLLSNKEERALMEFKRYGYLHHIGWVNSIVTESIVDAANNPIPWLTYPFIQFIEQRLNKKIEVFEFGSGNSTLYYANRTASVCSLEHDKLWYEKLKNGVPHNVKLFYCELEYGGGYCKYAAKTGRQYDMIIVDGRDRVNCCMNSMDSLNPGGVLVLDDSEREKYIEAVSFLIEKGFKKLDFWGIAPAINYLKCTSIFYRDSNCLGI